MVRDLFDYIRLCVMSGGSCDRLISRGVKLYNSVMFPEAYGVFNRALRLCPGDANALLWRGKAGLMLGRFDRAVLDLRRVLGLSTDILITADALLHLALALYLRSFFIAERGRALEESFSLACRAEASFKRINREYLRNMGGMLYNYGGAITSFYYYQRLSALIEILSMAELHMTDVAQEIWRRAFSVKPGNARDPPTALFFIATSYIKLVKRDAAHAGDVDFAMRMLELDARFLEIPLIILMKDLIHILKARMLSEAHGRHDEALAELGNVSSVGVMKFLASLYRGLIYERIGQRAEACRAYSGILRVFRSPRAMQRMRILNCDLTAQTHNAVSSGSVASCSDLVSEGIDLYNSMRVKESLDRFSNALALCPNDARALLWKGRAELMIGELDQSILTLRSTLGSGDGWVDANAQLYLALALYLHSLLSTDRDKALQEVLSLAKQAEEGFRRINDVYSMELSTLLQVLALYEAGNKDGAERIYNEAVESRQNIHASPQFIARAYLNFMNHDFENAIFTINYALGELRKDLVSYNLDLPLLIFLKDFIHLSKARMLMEGYADGEALSELNRVSGVNAVKLVARLYRDRIRREREVRKGRPK